MARDKRESIILYGSMLDALAELPPENIAEMVRAIRAYMRGEAFDFSNQILKAWFSDMRSRFDADADRFKAICDKRSEAGRRGNLARWGKSQSVANVANATSVSQKSQSVANVAENENENENDERKNLKKESPSGFEDFPQGEAPRDGYTLAEVLEAAKDPSVCVGEDEANAFFDYYDAQGWAFNNGRSVASLHSALRRWKRGKRDGPARDSPAASPTPQGRPNRNAGTYNDPNRKKNDDDPF